MTGMLASVRDISEAEIVLAAGVDIIDLKAPERGALGSLTVREIEDIVRFVAGRCPVSATIGDLPMLPDLIYDAVTRVAESGVDYVKIGFFPEGDWYGVLARLSGLTLNHALIAVLFADAEFDISWINACKTAGFHGVMLDTMDKAAGGLREILSISQLDTFVKMAKSEGLLCGLAGKLSARDIPELLPLTPDYLGFRGALCDNRGRVGAISLDATSIVRHAISCKVNECQSPQLFDRKH